MPFSLKNAPAFYTVMMQNLRDEWIALFNETKHSIVDKNSFNTIVCDDKIVIDDILLYSNHIPTLLHYFSCVANYFTKFRLSFKLSKCDFFKSRVELVGHYLTADGNCPARSMFNLIKKWPLPTHGTALLSFIGLCLIYSRYYPWFETSIRPLRRLQRSFHHTQLPIMAWSRSNISLFVACKSNIISSPLLLRYDSSKLLFPNTGWSTNGMGYILMQPDNCSESIRAL